MLRMPRFVVLLRGVNVGGHRKVPMAGLREHLTALGYGGVRTLLASGNVVLDAPRMEPAALGRRLAQQLEEGLGLATDVMVRSAAEWAAIVAANPFAAAAQSEPNRLLVVALLSAPKPAAVRATLAANKGPELVRVRGSEVYVHYRAGIADTKLDLKLLGSGTGRNWNTVLKLQALLQQ
jgi:uncharacterized protein (DUF1697 family)